MLAQHQDSENEQITYYNRIFIPEWKLYANRRSSSVNIDLRKANENAALHLYRMFEKECKTEVETAPSAKIHSG